MNLETRLDPRLWEAVRTSLESRRYSGAILDAIHVLSDVVRERSGLEGDGVALIGAAFGGSSPKLKVNRLQTETECNVQRGVESLLRGVYQAIRNPRSHGMMQDEESDAEALLLFLDYILRIVDRSRTPFSLDSFVTRVLDPDFVPRYRYAELLVREIPVKRRLSVCREILSRRENSDPPKLRPFFDVILKALEPAELAEFIELVSEELANTADDATIRFVLGVLPADAWPQLAELPRLRIEHKLIGSIRDGRYLRSTKRCLAGGLGTWASRIFPCFILQDDLWNAIATKLLSSDDSEQSYAFTYCVYHVQSCRSEPPSRLVVAVIAGLRAGDVRFKDLVDSWSTGQQGDRAADDPWRKPFAGALADFQPAENALDLSGDELPF
jgi:uncharacterized protein (TIGR02391 family)